ncbi:MAG: NUDIX hydrolase [Candidatus Microsaccharimonas sp.]
MFEQKSLQHHIQKYIIGVLIHKKYARFRDLRPPKTDTNLFSYHLKVLIKENWVEKNDNGYTLSKNGLAYVDRVSIEKLNIRSQPKIITMLLIQNSEGDVLIQKRSKQPYIDTWTLPYGKTHIDDVSIEVGARRESLEKLNYSPEHIRHAGDAYIRVRTDGELLSTTLAHIFRFETDDIVGNESIQWAQPLKLLRLNLAPAVEEIVSRTFFGDEHFFAEFTHDWVY